MTKRKPIVKPVDVIERDNVILIPSTDGSGAICIAIWPNDNSLIISAKGGSVTKETAKYLRRQLSSYITKGRFTYE